MNLGTKVRKKTDFKIFFMEIMPSYVILLELQQIWGTTEELSMD